jgi:hypothetical protein
MSRLLNIVMFAVAALCSFGAMSEEGVKYGGKNIAMTSVSAAPGSDGRKFHSNDIHNGIYIKSANYFFGKEYPNASELIRKRFVALGIKVTDNMEGADLALLFDSQGSMDMSNADVKAAHSSMPNNENIYGAASAGIVAGVPGLVAFASGGLFPTDSKTVLNAMVLLKPVKTKGMFGGDKVGSSVDGGTFTNGVTVKYKLEKGNEATEDLVLEMLVDQWVKQYMVIDGASVAASAVTASDTLAEVKK